MYSFLNTKYNINNLLNDNNSSLLTPIFEDDNDYEDVAVNVANALVSSRLDYCNSLYRSLSCRDLKKLQCVQNSLARIVIRTSKFSHITPVLRSLHWLPIRHRIRFKTASIIFKFLHTGTPVYFSPHLTRYTCAVSTRRSSPDNLYLHVPCYRTTINKSKVHFH